ncbi:MAG: type II secretion system protein GspC [Thermodesulfobacteriota bacterium]
MLTRIRRPYWIAAHLILLGLAATFAANAVSSIVRGRLSRTGVSFEQTTTDRTTRTKLRPLADYVAIARRDLFAAVPATEPVASGTTTRSGPASLQLLGTGSHGDKLYAVIEDAQSKEQRILGIGDKVGGAEVIDIGWRRMVLRRDGQEELLLVPPNLGGGGSSATTTAVTTSAAASADAESQIRKIGEDRYLVAQAEVDHSLENLSQLFTQMRAVPNMQDGKTNGFRLFAIRPGSLFQKIGLQNNDVVQRVNGIEINDPARALTLFQELQGEKRLNVDVVRGGETRTLSYEIR